MPCRRRELRTQSKEWPGGLEKPVQSPLNLLWIRTCGFQVSVDVLHRRLEDVQRVTELIEFGPRHDQLGLAQPELA